MTTTTAAPTSAPSSTPNDSPRLHDNDEASGTINQELQQHRNLKQDEKHDHIEQKVRGESAEDSPMSESPQPDVQHQLPDDDTSINAKREVATAPTTLTATTTTIAPSADKQIRLNEPPSSQMQSTTNTGTNNNAEQKRPMNAFLLFCKRQRSLVREKYPNLENRGITKILGDWWSKLDKEQKSKYTDLARQHKEAFMKANPNFKWCKTPNVSNINNNVNATNTTSEPHNAAHNHLLHQHRHQQSNHSSAASNIELPPVQSLQHPMDIVQQSTNSMDFMLTSRQQLEAPKPPKKRFLERNDSVYVSKSSCISNHQDTNSHGTDVVPYISLDQDTLDRVIDKAFSEDSNNSPSGINTCKCSTRTSTNITFSASNTNQNPFALTPTSTYSASNDEPVDFSMNRTINTTRQQIINNLVEKMLSKPTEDSGSFSKINGTDSVFRPPNKKDNSDNT